jgi:hypothetical protein
MVAEVSFAFVNAGLIVGRRILIVLSPDGYVFLYFFHHPLLH